MEGRQRVKADGADILLHYEPAYAGKAYEYAGQMIAAGKVCELSPCERLDESKAYAIRRGIACLYAVGETITPVSM